MDSPMNVNINILKIFEAFSESFGALPLASLINREYLLYAWRIIFK